MSDAVQDLHDRFERHDADGTHRENVIVTVEPETDLSRLESAGMEITNAMLSDTIISGHVNFASFKAISKLNGVVRIELDGEMGAL